MKSFPSPRHTGEAPARRPPENEPERIGEGELDEGPPRHYIPKPNDPSEDDEDLLDSDV